MTLYYNHLPTPHFPLLDHNHDLSRDSVLYIIIAHAQRRLSWGLVQERRPKEYYDETDGERKPEEKGEIEERERKTDVEGFV